MTDMDIDLSIVLGKNQCYALEKPLGDSINIENLAFTPFFHIFHIFLKISATRGKSPREIVNIN